MTHSEATSDNRTIAAFTRDPLPPPALARTVYLVGLLQGIALVAFPAAAAVLTAPSGYDLSSVEYGVLFLPQVAMAILGSLVMPSLSRRWGLKRLLVGGIGADAVAMAALTLSVPIEGEAAAFPVLLVSTAALGLGFGVTLSCLSALAATFRRERPELALTLLNVLLGLGTALSPLLVGVFTQLGEWWYLPLLTAIGLVVMLIVAVPQSIAVAGTERASGSRGVPAAFWIFAGSLVAYGVCETMFGNWGTTLLRDDGTAATSANYALAAFWASVTLGRLIISLLPRRVPTTAVYVVLPWAIAAALVLVAAFADNVAAGILLFAAGGFACAGFFPMTIGYGEASFPAQATLASGWLVASYQVGYGIAAFGAGALESVVPLTDLFLVAAGVAVAMGLLAIRITGIERSLRAAPTLT